MGPPAKHKPCYENLVLHPDQAARTFVLEIGTALQRFGTPTHRLESALARLADRLGLQGQFFTTPTQFMAGFGPVGQQDVAMVRVEPGEIDLEKLAALDELADVVARGELGVDEGLARVRAIAAAPPRYPGWVMVLAFGLVSAAAGRFLGGAVYEIAVAGGIGLVTGVLALAFGRTVAGARVFELVAAFVAAAAAHGAAHLGVPLSPQVTTLAGLIVLVPGLTLTLAMTELATRNLVSGTARLTAAAIVFLEIAFGLALAEQIFARAFGPSPAVVAAALPAWTEPAALLVATISIAGLFRAHPRATFGIVIAGITGFYSARFGAWLLGPELGACVGGFVIAAGSNVYARVADRPALVPLVPGILLLVPGSLGFRSLSLMLEDDVITGIDTGFAMVIVAVSLVAGLLIANATISPRRNL